MRSGHSESSSYRPDIDGLRAFAVVAVILCHVPSRGFPGGFLGVDVFFVISGFLIHRDLVGRLAARRLSIFDFYGRRLRRTLPALYVAALLTLVASAFVLLPIDFETLARSLLSVVASVPNIFFLKQVGYFDADAVTKPLLHTWSLGVEEQFYLVAPLLALALRSLSPSGRVGIMLTTFALAFVFTLVLRQSASLAAFYLMPSRLFEFFLGALLAEPWLPRPACRWQAEMLVGAALAALLACFIAFDSALPHPGWPTLVPCLATAILIHLGATAECRPRTMVTALLSARLPVAIGRISYSLYLYHWPILVLARYAELPTALPWRLGEGVLLLALSVTSYRLIEQPFRVAGSGWRRLAPVLLPAVAATLVAGCIVTLRFDGWPGRFRPDVDSLAAFAAYGDRKPFREGQCFITFRDDDGFDRKTCLALATGRPNVLLLGDSHAAHLWSGLRDAWPGVNFLQATASGCAPVLDSTGPRRCTDLMKQMFDEFIPSEHLDAVILAALWSDADIEPLRRTLAKLEHEGRHAIVFGPLPRYDVPMAALLARALLHGDLDEVARHRLPATESLDARLLAAVVPPATYISTWSALCPEGVCRLFAAPGVPMQFDYHHLTAPGSDALMATVAERHPTLFGDIVVRRLDLSRE